MKVVYTQRVKNAWFKELNDESGLEQYKFEGWFPILQNSCSPHTPAWMKTKLLYLYSAICDKFLSEISEKIQKWEIPNWDNPKWWILSDKTKKVIKMVKIVVETFGEDALRKSFLDLSHKDDRDE